jgi:hypothetical protein
MMRNYRNLLIAILISALFISEWFFYPAILTILKPSFQLAVVISTIMLYMPPFFMGLATGQWRYIMVIPLAMVVVFPFLPTDNSFFGSVIDMIILWVVFAIIYALGLGLHWLIFWLKRNQ